MTARLALCAACDPRLHSRPWVHPSRWSRLPSPSSRAQAATVEVRVRNTGTVVDEFTLDVLGDAAGWAAVEPPVLSLFPGAEGTANVVFRPPRVGDDARRARAVRAPRPLARGPRRVGGRGGDSVEVGAFLDPFAELVPRTSRGSQLRRATTSPSTTAATPA